MKYTKLQNGCPRVAGVLAGVLLAGAALAQTPYSPAGPNWDCIINGTEGVGLGYVTFYEAADNRGGTVEGGFIMRPNLPPVAQSSGTDPNSRNSGDVGRTGGTSPTPPATGTNSVAKSYGYTSMSGQWGYDSARRVVGNFYRVVQTGGSEGSTNSAATNYIGFKAIAVANSRLTMMAYMPGNRRALFTGVPVRNANIEKLNSLTDSSWTGIQRRTGEMLVEFFNLTPTEQPGAYIVSGSGAAYEIDGYAILSATGRMGFALNCNGKLRATVGSFALRSGKALTTGIIEPGSRVTFNAFHYPTY